MFDDQFNDQFNDAPILLVDDEPANVFLLERVLRKEGFNNIRSTVSPREFLAFYDDEPAEIVLLDLHMPELDGFAVMDELSQRMAPGDFLPIVILTADVNPEVRRRALSAGAKDFLTKPVDPIEVVLRIRNLLETGQLYRQLQDQNATLEQKVSERTRQLETAQIEILERLARAAEYRDDETGHHAQRVGHIAALIAHELGLPDEHVVLIRRAAPLHDVGKIGIPDDILLKPGSLTDAEFDEMKKHTAIGAGILSGSRFPVLQLAEEIAMYHHENWDGSGYMSLGGERIPVPAQIVRAADVFDALTHARPYKEAWSRDEALTELEDLTGECFRDVITRALVALHQRDRLAVEGAPPPLPEIFRQSADEDAERLRARAAEAESRLRSLAGNGGGPQVGPL
jgi:putative two-component system response regulator